MNILFVASRFPYPPIQGDRVRAFNFITELSKKHTIYLIAPSPEDPTHAKKINQFCRHIDIVSFSFRKKLLRSFLALFTETPIQIAYYYDPEIKKIIKKICKNNKIDIIHIQLLRMAPALESRSTQPQILDMIDTLSLNMSRRAKRENWFLSTICSIESCRLKAYEKKVQNQFDALLFSSQADCDIFDSSNTHVVPNGVNTEKFAYKIPETTTNTLIFTGRMKYFPNHDAIIWFITQIYPIIKTIIADTKLLVVGASPSKKLQGLSNGKDIVVTGYVDDIVPYLHQSDVAIAPLQSGTGIQNKVLEAMSCGTPVVATPFALGGIQAQTGKHVLTANSPEQFADHTITLLKSLELRKKISQSARVFVESCYTWNKSAEQLETIYRNEIEKKRNP